MSRLFSMDHQAQFTCSDLPLGGVYQGNNLCSFLVWAPEAKRVDLRLLEPRERIVPMRAAPHGYHYARVEGLGPGALYRYILNEESERPDPASRFQPNGVHEASAIVEPAFEWTDQSWFGLPLRDYILYELHVGTFTPEGTFDAIIPQLPALRELGITALEIMPIAQFPGERNWGYDGVYPYAVQNSYGGPQALKRLVDACHNAGLAAVLDVVYNHLGPEGNYLNDFGPYFTDRYHTAWGKALNFDGEHSDEVRRFFLENALYWQTKFHFDALRLDAVHAIRDSSAVPFLQDLARATRLRAEQLNRRFHLIAESDLNDARLITPEPLGGYGLDAQWSDDFHHCLHVLLTGERNGYYRDYSGVRQFAKVFREGYAYTGEYSECRKRRHGNSPRLDSPRQFVVYSQNHDQVGNRFGGERLAQLASFESLKLAAGSVLLSPFIPLLFMGEEYGEPAPFQYVISHTDPALVEAVRQGRKEEFAGFTWGGEVPDPQAETTFQQCVLNRDLRRTEESHRQLYQFYRELIRWRKELPLLREVERPSIETQARATEQVLWVHYHSGREAVLVLLCFAERPVSLALELPAGTWTKRLDSAETRWGGPGTTIGERLSGGERLTLNLSPKTLALLQRVEEGHN